MVNHSVKPLAETNGKDYWQTPAETIQLLTGDCEDYALLKYFACRQLGRDAMVLTLRLKDYGPHVMCGVKDTDSRIWLLDNISKDIVSFGDRFYTGGDIESVQFMSSLEHPSSEVKLQDPRFVAVAEKIAPNYDKDEITNFFATFNLQL
jgi:transglutaminase-like putative cysteine protease